MLATPPADFFTLDLLVGVFSTLGIGGLLLWVLQRQSSLIKTSTRMEVKLEGLGQSVEKLDSFRERLALNEAKSEAAHKRMDSFEASHH